MRAREAKENKRRWRRQRRPHLFPAGWRWAGGRSLRLRGLGDAADGGHHLGERSQGAVRQGAVRQDALSPGFVLGRRVH